MLSSAQLQSLKHWLKERNLFKAARHADRVLRSVPYAFQTFKFPSGERNLMLGQRGKIEGWITADLLPGADLRMNIKELRRLPQASFDRIYASHVLEHINCNDAQAVLQAMHGALKTGGKLFVVVPDLIAVSKLLDTDAAALAIDIIYGIPRATGDFDAEHQYGYTKKSLTELLSKSGFADVQDFEPFMDDTSKMQVGGLPISLCLTGTKR